MLSVAEPDTQQQYATLDWEVVDLLLSDDSVVQDMFEDIVTAEWPPTPHAPVSNPPGATGSTAGAEKLGPSASSTRLSPKYRIHRPGTDGWARERSPPTRVRPGGPDAQRTPKPPDRR